jgi:hypothetical protein
MRLSYIDPSNAELNPICHLLALLGAHLILHVSRIRVNTDIRAAPLRESTLRGTHSGKCTDVHERSDYNALIFSYDGSKLITLY